MPIGLGTRVRVVKPGLLHGHEGRVTSVSGDGDQLCVDLDQGITVLLSPDEVDWDEPATNAGPPNDGPMINVKLPEGVPVTLPGLPDVPFQPAICLLQVTPAQKQYLEQQFGQQLLPVLLTGDGAPPQHPQMAPPVFPDDQPGTSPMQVPDPDDARLNQARHMAAVFLNLRFAMLRVADSETNHVDGEEWKNNGSEFSPFELLKCERQLYETCCHMIRDYLVEPPQPD